MSVILCNCGGYAIDTSLAAAWICLILNLPLHYGLYIYLDQVMPDTYGIRKHPLFCLRRRRNEQNVYSSLIQDEESSLNEG